jgi:hypothetical protein
MDRARVVSELAELGSIDALLARHESLAREEVVSALRYAADLIAAETEPQLETSPLYRAYNGYMLGLFTAAAMVFSVREETERRETTLHRLLEFLLEIRHEFGRPLTLDDPAGRPQEAFDEDAIDALVRELDHDLADYYQLGLATFRYVVLGAGADDEEEAHRLLRALGHPPMIFRSTIDEPMRAGASEERTWQDMMTICLRLARELVAGLAEEGDTCFVALPFTAPYEGRYLNFYRGAARRLKLQSIRAWGGLGQEEHQELLLALIAKSGALLAEVSEPNANVALEVGFALGQNKSVFLVAEQDRWKNAANIQLDWVFPYRVAGEEPEPHEVDRAGLYFTTLRALRRPGPIPAWSAKPVEVLQKLNEIFAKESPGQEPGE